MKRIISLKKISPFLTEVFRENVKIGTIDYQNAKDYQINLDDTIAQAVMDTEVAAIKKALEDFMNNFILEKTQEMENYKNLTLIVDLDRVKNEHVATITQVFNEKKQFLLTDYENYRKNVTTESNAFKISVEAEKKNIKDLSTSETVKIQTEGSKQLTDIGLLGDTKKNILETDYENYRKNVTTEGNAFKTSVETEKKNIKDLSTSETVKIQTEGSKQLTDIGLLGDTKKNILEIDYIGYKTKLESLVNINNFEKIIGKNFKGVYDPVKKYENGDIYYKDSLINIGFSIPNISSPTLTKNLTVEKIEKFLIYGECEREFQLCNNKQFGIVGLNLGKTLIKDGELNSTSVKFPIIFNIVGFSIPSDGTTTLGKTLINLDISSAVLEKANIEMSLHKNLIGSISKYQY